MSKNLFESLKTAAACSSIDSSSDDEHRKRREEIPKHTILQTPAKREAEESGSIDSGKRRTIDVHIESNCDKASFSCLKKPFSSEHEAISYELSPPSLQDTKDEEVSKDDAAPTLHINSEDRTADSPLPELTNPANDHVSTSTADSKFGACTTSNTSVSAASNKNIWTQLALQPSLHESTNSQSRFGSGSSVCLAPDESALEAPPPCLSPIIQTALSEPFSVAPQLRPSISTVPSQLTSEDDESPEESQVVTSSQPPKLENSDPAETDAASRKSKDETNPLEEDGLEKLSIESGEIVSEDEFMSDNRTDVSDTDKCITEDTDNAEAPQVDEEKHNIHVDDEEMNADSKEDKETKENEDIEDAQEIMNEDDDENFECASVNSEVNDLIIAFPDCDDGLELIDEEIVDTDEHNASPVARPATKRDSSGDARAKDSQEIDAANSQTNLESQRVKDKIREIKIEDSEDYGVREETTETRVETVGFGRKNNSTETSKVEPKNSVRQVSFFEKAADFFGKSLFDTSDINLSPPGKSVFGAFVSSDKPREETVVALKQEVLESVKKEVNTDETSTTNEATNEEASGPVVGLNITRNPCDFLYESISVNELLMKEEDEEEEEEEEEDSEEGYGGTASNAARDEENDETSEENISLLNKVVDRLMPSKADSRLSVISKRLRNRMPHWDDSFNEAFVPQIRNKPSFVPPSVGPSGSHHSSSDNSKRLKNNCQTSEMQLKSIIAQDDLFRSSRDMNVAFVPQHVKKVRQFLTTLNICQHANEKGEKKSSEEDSDYNHDSENRLVANIKMGSPTPKAAPRSRKFTYHDSKKALRMPQKLVRNLPSPTIASPNAVDPPAGLTAGPVPATPTSAVEFRSSLGASVRTKPRAFTKAALRKQIVEEASTAKPQFRVKTRPTADGGSGSLAIVITRVTRPPKRSLSASFSETESKENAEDGTEKLKTPAADKSPGKSEPASSGEAPVKRSKLSFQGELNDTSDEEAKEGTQGSVDGDVGDGAAGEGGSAGGGVEKSNENSADEKVESASSSKGEQKSPDKAAVENKASNDAEKSSSGRAVKSGCATEELEQAVGGKRRRRDSDGSATSSARGLGSSDSSARSSNSSSRQESPEKSKRGPGDVEEKDTQSYEEDPPCRDAVNFRGVASNRKRLKNQKKHRLLLEIENTSGFIMEKNRKDTREQRALERLMLQNCELLSDPQSEKRLDPPSIHTSPRVLLQRMSPEQLKPKKKKVKHRKQSDAPGAHHDYRNRKIEKCHQRKPPSLGNVAAANRITAKYAAAKIDRARGCTTGSRESSQQSFNMSVHRSVRAILRRQNGRDFYGRTALHLAASLGHLDSVVACLKLNMNLNAHDHSGLYPIHAAAKNGNVPVLKALLDAGADVNQCARADGASPLHEAASNGKVAAVRELLSRGADRTMTRYDGTTPADCAQDDWTRNLLEDSKPETVLHSKVPKTESLVDDMKFEMMNRYPPLSFVIWLESTQRWTEVVLLSDLCEYCGIDKVNIRVHNPSIHIVKVSMAQLHYGMRNNVLWPALRMRLRVEGSLQEHKSVDNVTRNLIALVMYTQDIRALTGTVNMIVSCEDILKEKDPPPPCHLFPRRKRRMSAKESFDRSIRKRRSVDPVRPSTKVKIEKDDDTLAYERPALDVKPISKPEIMLHRNNRIKQKMPPLELELIDAKADRDSYHSSSSDEDVVITGIFSAPTKPSSSHFRNFEKTNVQQRKRPVASVVPNRIQPHAAKARKVIQEPGNIGTEDSLSLREEYEQLKMERRDLMKKEMQLREKLLAISGKNLEGRLHLEKSKKYTNGIVTVDPCEDNDLQMITSELTSPNATVPAISPTMTAQEVSSSRMKPVGDIPSLELFGQSSRSSECVRPDGISPLKIAIPSLSPSRPGLARRVTSCPSTRAVPSDHTYTAISKNRGITGIPLHIQKPSDEITTVSQFSGPGRPTSALQSVSGSSCLPTRLPSHQTFHRTKVVPTHVSFSSTQSSVNVPVFHGRQISSDGRISNGRPVQHLLPVTNPKRLLGPPAMTRMTQPNFVLGVPPVISTPQGDTPDIVEHEDNIINASSSPSCSPPLLVPQGPVTNHSNSAYPSPIQSSTPPVLFPQEPPVLLPCPKIVDTNYSVNKAQPKLQPELVNLPEDDAPPRLTPLNVPSYRKVKCASEILKKKRTVSSFVTSPISTVPISVHRPNRPLALSEEMLRKVGLAPINGSASQNNDSINVNRKFPKRAFAIFSGETASRMTVTGQSILANKTKVDQTITRSLTPTASTAPEVQHSSTVSTGPDVSKSTPDSAKEAGNINMVAEKRPTAVSANVKNNERRKKVPLLHFQNEGEEITLNNINIENKVLQSDAPVTYSIDLTGASPSPPSTTEQDNS